MCYDSTQIFMPTLTIRFVFAPRAEFWKLATYAKIKNMRFKQDKKKYAHYVMDAFFHNDMVFS